MADDLLHNQDPAPQPQPDQSAEMAQRLAQAEQQAQALHQQNQQYQQYLQQLAYAAQQAQQAQQQQQPQQAAEEDDLWADPKKMRAQMQQEAERRAQEIARQTIAPIAQTYLQNTYASNRHAAMGDQSMPHFKKWEQEIFQVLSQVDPGIAARYDAWQAAYQLVSTRHLDEIVQERVAQARATPSEDEGEDEATPTLPTPSHTQPVPQRYDSPAPISNALGRASSPVTVKKQPRLNADEAFYAQVSGCTPEEYRRYQQNDSEDVLGFNGRSRV